MALPVRILFNFRQKNDGPGPSFAPSLFVGFRTFNVLFWGMLSAAAPAFSAPFCAQVHLPAPSITFRSVPEDPFMAARSNAPHFWYWASRAAHRYFDPETLDILVSVVGDPHILNFGDIKTENGIHFGLIDLDDSGRGPAVLDIVKLMTTAQTMKRPQKPSLLIEAYLAGLRGEKIDKPEFLQFANGKFDFETELFDFGDHSHRDGKFRQDRLGLQPYVETPESRTAVQNALQRARESFPEAVLSDAAVRIKAQGGSAGLKRIWLLLKIKKHYAVFELKEMALPATIHIREQADHTERIAEVMKNYWKQETAVFKVVTVSDQQSYWMRPRLWDQFDSAELNPGELREYVHYLAYYMGKRQRKQLSEDQLAVLLRDERSLTSALQAIVKDYVEMILPLNRQNPSPEPPPGP